MDIDVMGRHIRDLLNFKGEIEGLLSQAKSSGPGEVHISAADAQQILSFLPQFDAAMVDVSHAIQNASALAGDVAMIRKDIGPIIEWVQAKQKAEADVAAGEAAKPKEPLLDEGTSAPKDDASSTSEPRQDQTSTGAAEPPADPVYPPPAS
jgi:hypothetical protein